MSNAGNNKKMRPMVDLPECPVCLDTLSAPIYLCQSGHSVCNSCIEKLKPPACTRCRRPISKIRNWQLEDLIDGATTSCPNKESGCTYIIKSGLIDDHVKECIFRVMKCPLEIFATCFWSGACREMVDHFKKLHPQNLLMDLDEEVTINNISIAQDGIFVYVVLRGSFIYILTLQIDINKQLVYWVVQSSSRIPEFHVYKINIHNEQDNRSKVTFSDCCFSDAMATAEIISQSQCFVLSLPFFNKFIYENKVTFDLKISILPLLFRKPNTDPQQSNINFKKFKGST